MLRPRYFGCSQKGTFCHSPNRRRPLAQTVQAHYHWEALKATVHSLFVPIEIGDLVAVQPPRQEPFIGQVLYVDSAASSQYPHNAQVIREDTMAIVSINPGWVLDRVPGEGPVCA